MDIFGYDTVEEFINIPILKHCAPEYKEAIKERFRKDITGTYEFKIKRKDREIRDVEILSSRVIIAGQKYAQATFRDITEQKKKDMYVNPEDYKKNMSGDYDE